MQHTDIHTEELITLKGKAKVDLRLLDCMNILSGYQNVTVNNTTAENLEPENVKENEVTDEEG